MLGIEVNLRVQFSEIYILSSLNLKWLWNKHVEREDSNLVRGRDLCWCLGGYWICGSK